ncbi:MAG: TlpA family protein disulfide reductase [Streptosporangiaceae bacterium]
MLKVRRRATVLLSAAGAVLLAGGITVAARSGGGSPERDVSYVGGNTSALYYLAGHRKPAPGFTGTMLAGGTLKFSSYREGKVVVLNFWGSWCVPCRKEAPTLAAAAAAYRGLGVEFLGVDEQDAPASALAFEKSFKLGYPSVNDSGGQVVLGFSQAVPISAIPATLVIDTGGRIAGAILGQASYPELSTILNRVTGKEAP